MEELNTTKSVGVVKDTGWDPLTLVDMGDAVAISQVDEGGNLHNVIISLRQAEELSAFLAGVLS